MVRQNLTIQAVEDLQVMIPTTDRATQDQAAIVLEVPVPTALFKEMNELMDLANTAFEEAHEFPGRFGDRYREEWVYGWLYKQPRYVALVDRGGRP